MAASEPEPPDELMDGLDLRRQLRVHERNAAEAAIGDLVAVRVLECHVVTQLSAVTDGDDARIGAGDDARPCRAAHDCGGLAADALQPRRPRRVGTEMSGDRIARLHQAEEAVDEPGGQHL